MYSNSPPRNSGILHTASVSMCHKYTFSQIDNEILVSGVQ